MILLLWYFENKNEQICFTLKTAWCTCAVTTFHKPYGRFLTLHMAMQHQSSDMYSCDRLHRIQSDQGY